MLSSINVCGDEVMLGLIMCSENRVLVCILLFGSADFPLISTMSDRRMIFKAMRYLFIMDSLR